MVCFLVQLMCALENISQLRVDYQEQEMPTTSRPVKPVGKTGSKPVAREVEEVLCDFI